MRYFFFSHPSVRLLLCAAGGIMAAVYLPVQPLLWLFMALGGCLTAFILFFIDRKRLSKGKLSAWSVLTYLFLVFASFAFHASVRYRVVSTPTLLSRVGREVIVSGSIDGRPVVDEGRTTILFRASEVFEEGQSTPVFDRVKVIVRQGDKSRTRYEEGEFVRVKGRLGLIPVAANRGEFDPRWQNRLKGIHVQLFCAGPWFVLREPQKSGFSLYPGLINPLRSYLSDALELNMPDGAEKQFVKGMILGERDQLSDELYDAFRRTGTAHVLAVSGLHVALLAYVVNLCLQRMKVTSVGRWLSMLILVSVIGVYSFVTGNAPSIKRAAIMSAMMIAGSTIGRKTYSVNSLAASDVVILLIDPFDLFSAGFLMTNGAVLGILTLYQPILRLVPDAKSMFRHLVHLVWSAFSVSLAAMIGVSPVIALWFGTFSVVGLIANLPVVFFSNLAMYAAMPVFLFHGFAGWIASFFGASTWLSAYLTLFFTEYFSRFTFATIEIRPDLFEVTVLYVMIVFALHALTKRAWGRASMVVLSALNLLVWYQVFRPVPKPPGVVSVNVGREVAVLFSSGAETLLIDAGRYAGSHDRLWRQSETWGLNAPIAALSVFSPDSVIHSLSVPVVADGSPETVYRTFVIRRPEEKVLRIDSKIRSLLLVSGMGRLEGQRADGADVIFWIYRFTEKEWRRLDAWRLDARPGRMLLVPGSFMSAAQRGLLDRYAKSRPGVEVRSGSRQTAWY